MIKKAMKLTDKKRRIESTQTEKQIQNRNKEAYT